MAKAKIFVIAPDAYGIDKSICRALELLGFQVLLKNTRSRLNFLEAVSLRAVKRLPFTAAFFNPVLRHFLALDNREYLRIISEFVPDLLLVIKGETVFPGTLEEVKEKYRIPCVAYIWDCPFYSYTGQFADIYRANNFSRAMRLYEHIFVYDPYYVRKIKERGINAVSYLPLAADPARYRKTEFSKEEKKLAYDICFVGSPFPNRRMVLDRLSGFNLGVFGDGWKKWYWFGLKRPPAYYRGRASGDKVAKIYSAAKVVLNIHDPETRDGLNTRTFEILSCGAFELVDFRPELGKFFKIPEEIVCYKEIEEIGDLVRHYLAHPMQRQEIAEQGMRKVINNHTWLLRMQEALSLLNEKGIFTAAQ
jgi:spore maturation protein CgeB